jgi:hypothetical protein
MNLHQDEGPRLRSALLLSQAGLTLAFASVIGFLGGYYLDQWLHTSPWFVLILGALGVVAGFRELIRTLNRVNQDEEELARAERGRREARAGMRDAGSGMRDTGYGTEDRDTPARDARAADRQADDDSDRDKSE